MHIGLRKRHAYWEDEMIRLLLVVCITVLLVWACSKKQESPQMNSAKESAHQAWESDQGCGIARRRCGEGYGRSGGTGRTRSHSRCQARRVDRAADKIKSAAGRTAEEIKQGAHETAEKARGAARELSHEASDDKAKAAAHSARKTKSAESLKKRRCQETSPTGAKRSCAFSGKWSDAARAARLVVHRDVRETAVWMHENPVQCEHRQARGEGR